MVRTGVMQAYGVQLKHLAQQAEGRILPAFGSGLFVAIVLQSSTATALIAATFSGQSVITAATAFTTILGADVGTAIAVVIASQNLAKLTPFLISIGIFGYLTTSNSKLKNLFRAISGLGLILLALSLISKTATVLSTIDDFITVIRVLESHHLFLLIFALGLTYLAHSSLAVVLMSTGFVASGLIGIEGGLVLVLGANLGSGLLPVVFNWNEHNNARIPVAANLLIRGTCVLAILPFIAPLIEQAALLIQNHIVAALPGESKFAATIFSVKMAPAAFHLALNLVVALSGILLTKPLLKITASILPANKEEGEEDESVPKFLDFSDFSTPAVSLACAKRETLNMAHLAQKMFAMALPVLRDNNQDLRERITRMDDSLDNLYNEIKLYISRILAQELTPEESQLAMDMLSFTTNMEHIGDIIDCSLMVLADKKISDHLQFSEEGLAEISDIYDVVSNNFELAINTFVSRDATLARQLYETKEDLRKLEIDSVESHLQRIGQGIPESLVTSSLHVDVLRDLKRINSHIAAIAYPILVASGEVLKTRWKRKKEVTV